MGATSITGHGNPNVINKGSVHQTLGYQHIIDLPKFALPFTEFPPDGNWNTIAGNSGTQTLESFFVGFYSNAFYVWDLQYVNANLITSEEIVSIIDPSEYINSVSFDTVDDSSAPYPHRVIIVDINTSVNPPAPIVNWKWNNKLFSVLILPQL